MKPAHNLRGWHALIETAGRLVFVEIVTHIRNDTWMVEGSRLPQWCERWRGCRRMTVARSEMLAVFPDKPDIQTVREITGSHAKA